MTRKTQSSIIILSAFLVVLSLMYTGCKKNASFAVQVVHLGDSLSVASKLAGRWMLLPLIAQDETLESYDYGNLVRHIQKFREGQQIRLWNPLDHTLPIQEEAYQHYCKLVREERRQDDSLLSLLRGSDNAKVLFAPMLSGHILRKNKQGQFERRLTLNFTVLDYQSGDVILRGQASALHNALTLEKLMKAPELFSELLYALSVKLDYNPLAGLAPSTIPDF